MEDKQPVVSLVKLGGEQLLVVKIDPDFVDPTGHYVIDIQVQPQQQQLGGGGDCTVQGNCAKCTRLTVIPVQ